MRRYEGRSSAPRQGRHGSPWCSQRGERAAPSRCCSLCRSLSEPPSPRLLKRRSPVGSFSGNNSPLSSFPPPTLASFYQWCYQSCHFSTLRLRLRLSARRLGLRQAASQLLLVQREAEMLRSEGLLKARAC